MSTIMYSFLCGSLKLSTKLKVVHFDGIFCFYVNNFAYLSSWGHFEVVWYLIQFILQFQVRLFDDRKPPEAVKKYIWPRGTFEWDVKKWPFVQLTLETKKC